jgi:hypothetical protein
MTAKQSDPADLPEGLRRSRKSATPAPQSWADLSKNGRKIADRREDQSDRGITRDQRGQVQPKDKDTARRA